MSLVKIVKTKKDKSGVTTEMTLSDGDKTGVFNVRATPNYDNPCDHCQVDGLCFDSTPARCESFIGFGHLVEKSKRRS